MLKNRATQLDKLSLSAVILGEVGASCGPDKVAQIIVAWIQGMRSWCSVIERHVSASNKRLTSVVALPSLLFRQRSKEGPLSFVAKMVTRTLTKPMFYANTSIWKSVSTTLAAVAVVDTSGVKFNSAIIPSLGTWITTRFALCRILATGAANASIFALLVLLSAGQILFHRRSRCRDNATLTRLLPGLKAEVSGAQRI